MSKCSRAKHLGQKRILSTGTLLLISSILSDFILCFLFFYVVKLISVFYAARLFGKYYVYDSLCTFGSQCIAK